MRLDRDNDVIDDITASGSSSDKLEATLTQVPDASRALSSELLLPRLNTPKWSLEPFFCRARWRVAVWKDNVEEKSSESTSARRRISLEYSSSRVWKEHNKIN